MRALPRFHLLSLIGSATLVACGGSNAPGTITGMAANGAALANASVVAKCLGGTSNSATTGSDGTFSIDLQNGQRFPCVVQVTGSKATLYGFADAEGRINVTPLTDLVISKAAAQAAPAVFETFDSSKAVMIRANVAAARDYVIAEVAPLAGLVPTGDLLTQAFKVGDSNDRVLDSLGATLLAAGKTLAALESAAATGTLFKAALPAEEARPHDAFPYAPKATEAAATTFAAMAAATGDTVDMSTTSRWQGVLGGAIYRVEVPANWNGELVMYTHGYAGEDMVLTPFEVTIRRYLIQNGYAWAASSYSKKSYDVRAGVEDTNALALRFATIAKERGRTLAAPSKTYIIGHSMGGHIAAAAVEAETLVTANNKVKYDGAVPMCGVMGDTELFNTFGALQLTAQTLAGQPATPYADWNKDNGKVKTAVTSALFATGFPAAPVSPNGAAGLAYTAVIKNLTGGTRPLFDLGYAYGGSFAAGPYAFFGIDTIMTGLTTKAATDTNRFTYVIDGDAAASAAQNAATQKLTAAADFNRLRRDGLRWIPKLQGQVSVPVVTMHTLGDLFVPFSMQQIYKGRVVANGADQWLVQRAIRGVTHCDFTLAEESKAFSDMVKWVKQGTKPVGDDVVTPATVAASNYGCTHTNNTLVGDDVASTKALRGLVAQAGKSCPAN